MLKYWWKLVCSVKLAYKLAENLQAFKIRALPSRGEGRGTLVETITMEDYSYPLPVDRVNQETEGPFKGHLWVELSECKLSNT